MTSDGRVVFPVDPAYLATTDRHPTTPAASGQVVVRPWCTVRVRGPFGSIDVALPSGATVAEVTEELAGRLLPGAPLGRPGEPHHLHRLGENPLPRGARLADLGLRDGVVLHLGAAPLPHPAQPIDDPLVSLAEGAARAGRWGPRGVAVAATIVAVAFTTVATAIGVALPGGPIGALVLALGLFGVAMALRERLSDLPAFAAVLASLPAWAGVGAGGGVAAGSGPADVVLGAASAVVVGTALAMAALSRRRPWWLAVGSVALTVGIGASIVTAGWLTPVRVAAIAVVVWLVIGAVAPWIASRRWSGTTPDAAPEPDLLDRAAATRRTLDALGVAGATVIVLGLLAVAGSGEPLAPGFAAAAAVVALLRSRRSVFLVESGSALGAGVVGLAAAAFATAAEGPDAGALVALGLLLALVVTVLVAVRAARAAEGDEDAVAWWSLPRTRRTLDILEGLAAVAVLPLLLGVLGVYELAADAGASL